MDLVFTFQIRINFQCPKGCQVKTFLSFFDVSEFTGMLDMKLEPND